MTTPTPAALPLVEVLELDDDTVEVRMDGGLVISGPFGRSDLGRVLAVLAEQHAGPVRIVLTDRTGRAFVDVLTPPSRPSPFAPPMPARTVLPDPAPPAVGGFLPGEEVLIATVTSTLTASPTGTIPEPAGVSDGVSGIIVFGTRSGSITVRRP